MVKQKRIIIVGAGPIGCYCAQLLRLKGYEPLVIEEHQVLGKPVHCAGLVGRKVIDEIKIPFPKNCLLNSINSGRAHLRNEVATFKRNNVAFVIDREKFDKAMGQNLNIVFQTKCLGIEENKTHYILETDKGDMEADIIIGADGANSIVRSFVVGEKTTSFLKGVQFRMRCAPAKSDMVEIFIEKPFFYWIIPEGPSIVRVGILSRNPYHDLMGFIHERGMKGEIIEKFAGLVPLMHFTSFSRGRVFLVGDSASQIKPLSYGGIYMGMRAAEILAECIGSKKYEQYAAIWDKRFGREVNIALKAREIFHKLDNKELKKIFSFVRKKVALIEQKGDFENHSSIAWEFLKDPYASKEIISILLKIIKASFKK
ncbi:MAG: NAD(P)/FAD-dependent oxidoreductase [Candidatus Omnitrophica bacterium]|nr:NAD(P)/FAD-dependent oxidoreductase [Candidatus Omnitrophota bacterium]